jgi:polysaccharide deacetylase 2 family uncharacterized protein YibQ
MGGTVFNQLQRAVQYANHPGVLVLIGMSTQLTVELPV